MALAVKPRASIEGQHFHVVVIGGGINGVAIARECARAGKRTLLVEQNDFASGVTSRSTRIIHGGLRYLEHGEIGLVRESVRERERLLRERSHLVHPVQFLFLLNEQSQRSAMKVRAGLWLYQRISGRRAKKPGEIELMRVQRALDAGHQWLLLNYEDAQCEFPERLVAEWMTEAAAAGAVVRNHCEVLAVNVGQGRARGVLLRDRLTGKDERVDAGWVINCTGPWADRICQRSTVRTGKPMLGGVRGSHIVLPRFSGSPTVGLYTEAADGRPVFVLPWNEQVLVGTTEVPDAGDPAKTAPIRGGSRLFAPHGLEIVSEGEVFRTRHQVCVCRSASAAEFGDKPSAVTRRHFLHDHTDDGAARLISVIGGKLTTAASLARELARKIGIAVEEPKAVTIGPGSSLDPMLDQEVLDIARAGSVSEETARGHDGVAWTARHGYRPNGVGKRGITGADLPTHFAHCGRGDRGVQKRICGHSG